MARGASGILAAWGRFVHRHRWLVLGLSLATVPVSLWLARYGGRLDSAMVPSATDSGRALELMQEDLPRRPLAFHLVLGHPTLRATDVAFREAAERALAPVRRDGRVAAVRTPWDGPTPAPDRVSRDGRHARVSVELKGHGAVVESMVFVSEGAEAYAALRPMVRSDELSVVAAGALALQHDFTEMTKRDVRRAEFVILPVVPILLVAVFGSLAAAALPLAVGLLAMAAGTAGTLALARVMSVSIYATNVLTMIGLAVAIDYSLFIVSRYREEIRRGPPETAVATALATAGEAVLFSGLTVAVGLLGLYSLGLGNLGSIGLCGTLVVTFAVLYALTFLPALLSVLGPRIDAGRLPRLPWGRRDRGVWMRVATFVMTHPWKTLVPTVALLLLVGAPFLHIRLGTSEVGMLPRSAEARRGDELLREFRGQETTPIPVVVDYGTGSPLTPDRVGALHDLSRALARDPDVSRIESFVDLDPSMTRQQYQALASMPGDAQPPAIRAALAQTMGSHLAILVVHTRHPASSTPARDLVERLRVARPPADGRLLVTGHTALEGDFIALVRARAPRAVGLIVAVTYVVLLVLLRSFVLPLKAVVMNFLSITASYGALVWIFQDGHLARWLDFDPGPIDSGTPLIMFCVLFGLSMDYGVLLLSRIREEYQRTGDNTRAVGIGLERTGRLITAAAAIMAAIFFAFALADLVVIKAIGVGMAIAVVADATIVRALVVPATMRLLGRWNWWAPGWLAPRPSTRRRAGPGTAG